MAKNDVWAISFPTQRRAAICDKLSPNHANLSEAMVPQSAVGEARKSEARDLPSVLVAILNRKETGDHKS